MPAQGGTNTTPLGTVVHFHGNAQNLTAHYAFVDALPAAGFNVFSFDYRGYGRSGGRPDRRGLEVDARAALDYIVNPKPCGPSPAAATPTPSPATAPNLSPA